MVAVLLDDVKKDLARR